VAVAVLGLRLQAVRKAARVVVETAGVEILEIPQSLPQQVVALTPAAEVVAVVETVVLELLSCVTRQVRELSTT
jgi:hypothetical protein